MGILSGVLVNIRGGVVIVGVMVRIGCCRSRNRGDLVGVVTVESRES
jgi:hypothetical protein